MHLILLILFISGSIFAKTTDPCEDLTPQICSLKPRNDGTGIFTPVADFEEKKDQDLKTLRNQSKSKFKELLKDPAHSEFKKNLLQALKPLKKHSCFADVELKKEKCLDLYSEQLAYMVESGNIALPGSTPFFKEFKDRDFKKVAELQRSPEYEKILNEHFESLKKINSNHDQEKKVEKLFLEVKKAFLEKIKNLPIEPEVRDKLMKQAEKTKLGGLDCINNPRNLSKFVNAQYLPKAGYKVEKGNESVEICRGITSFAKSDFSVVFTLAHELAHSIDPCLYFDRIDPSKFPTERTEDRDSEYPLSEVVSCLRNKRSIKAENFLDVCRESKKDSDLYKENGCSSNDRLALYCNGKDQIGEATSDQFATEIMYDMIKQRYPDLTPEQWKIGVTNAIPDVSECSVTKGMRLYSGHPSHLDRTNKIILAHPKIRQAMQCPEKSKNKLYCDMQKVKVAPGSVLKTNKSSP